MSPLLGVQFGAAECWKLPNVATPPAKVLGAAVLKLHPPGDLKKAKQFLTDPKGPYNWGHIPYPTRIPIWEYGPLKLFKVIGPLAVLTWSLVFVSS